MLVRCPDCGREISDAAPSCPNCGRPNAAVHALVGSAHAPRDRGSALKIAVAVAIISLTLLAGLVIFMVFRSPPSPNNVDTTASASAAAPSNRGPVSSEHGALRNAPFSCHVEDGDCFRSGNGLPCEKYNNTQCEARSAAYCFHLRVRTAQFDQEVSDEFCMASQTGCTAVQTAVQQSLSGDQNALNRLLMASACEHHWSCSRLKHLVLDEGGFPLAPIEECARTDR